MLRRRVAKSTSVSHELGLVDGSFDRSESIRPVAADVVGRDADGAPPESSRLQVTASIKVELLVAMPRLAVHLDGDNVIHEKILSAESRNERLSWDRVAGTFEPQPSDGLEP